MDKGIIMSSFIKFELPTIVSKYVLPVNSFAVHVSFNSSHTANNRNIIVSNTNHQGKIRVIGDGHFVDSDLTTDLGTELTYTGVNQNIYVSDGESDIIFENKETMLTFSTGSYNIYGTKYLSMGDMKYMPSLVYLTPLNFISYEGRKVFSIDDVDTSAITQIYSVNNSSVNRMKCIYGALENIKNRNNITNFRLSGQNLTGNILSLSLNTVLTALDISYNKLEGNIANLGATLNITELGVQGNLNIYGNIEDWLNKLHDSGKNSGEITLRLYDSQIKYNDNYILNGTIYKATFDENGWTMTEV